MSNSALVSYTQISPNRNSPRNQPIRKITIHHMAGSLTLEQFGTLVANPGRQMSANYAIDQKGGIGLYCPESDRSWCSSSPWNDHQAVTIEVANDGGAPDWHVSDASIAALIDLCVDICQRNGMAQLEYTGDQNGSLTLHRMFAATQCPGPYLLSKIPYIAQQVTARLQAQEADPQQFVDVMVEKCQQRCIAAGILPSLCIAQACVESAYGTSELAVNANNLFGIKASGGWTGKTYTKQTREWDGSKYITVSAVFRAYDTMVACVEDYLSKLTTMERYANLVGCTDIREACRLIREDGWATSPTYTETLLARVDKHNLTQYDQLSGNSDMQRVWLDSVEVPVSVAMEFYMAAKKHGLDNDKAYHAENVTQRISIDATVLTTEAAMDFYAVAHKHGLDGDKAYHAEYVKG